MSYKTMISEIPTPETFAASRDSFLEKDAVKVFLDAFHETLQDNASQFLLPPPWDWDIYDTTFTDAGGVAHCAHELDKALELLAQRGWHAYLDRVSIDVLKCANIPTSERWRSGGISASFKVHPNPLRKQEVVSFATIFRELGSHHGYCNWTRANGYESPVSSK